MIDDVWARKEHRVTKSLEHSLWCHGSPKESMLFLFVWWNHLRLIRWFVLTFMYWNDSEKWRLVKAFIHILFVFVIDQENDRISDIMGFCNGRCTNIRFVPILVFKDMIPSGLGILYLHNIGIYHKQECWYSLLPWRCGLCWFVHGLVWVHVVLPSFTHVFELISHAISA